MNPSTRCCLPMRPNCRRSLRNLHFRPDRIQMHPLGDLLCLHPPVFIGDAARVCHHGDRSDLRNCRDHDLEPLRDQLLEQRGCAGHVRARSREACHEPRFYRVAVHRHDDRNRRGGVLGGARRRDAGSHDGRRVALDQRRGELRKLVRRSPVHVDDDVLPVDPSEFAKPVPERAEKDAAIDRRSLRDVVDMRDSGARHRCRRERERTRSECQENAAACDHRFSTKRCRCCETSATRIIAVESISERHRASAPSPYFTAPPCRLHPRARP